MEAFQGTNFSLPIRHDPCDGVIMGDAQADQTWRVTCPISAKMPLLLRSETCFFSFYSNIPISTLHRSLFCEARPRRSPVWCGSASWDSVSTASIWPKLTYNVWKNHVEYMLKLYWIFWTDLDFVMISMYLRVWLDFFFNIAVETATSHVLYCFHGALGSQNEEWYTMQWPFLKSSGIIFNR